MKIEEIRSKTDDELHGLLADLARELFNLRMQRAMSKQPKPHLFAIAKTTAARIKTVLTERRRADDKK